MKEWIYKDGSGKYVLTTDPEVANLCFFAGGFVVW